MNVRTALPTNAEAAKLMKPTEAAFHHPAGVAQAASMFGIAPGQHRLNATPSQLRAMSGGVIGPIALHALGSTSRVTALASDRGNPIHQRQQLSHVVTIGRREGDDQRDALRVREDVVFRARFAAIGRIRSGVEPPFSARTEPLSTTPRDQSIWSAACSAFNNTRWTLFHTPVACQSCNRRQHDIPDPQPISLGSISHGMPLLSTYRMPVRAARCGIGLRPGYRRRRFFGGGNRGSISSHSASSKIGFDIGRASLPVRIPSIIT